LSSSSSSTAIPVSIDVDSSDDEADIIFSRGRLLGKKFLKKMKERDYACLVCGHRSSTQLIAEVHLARVHGQDSTQALEEKASLLPPPDPSLMSDRPSPSLLASSEKSSSAKTKRSKSRKGTETQTSSSSKARGRKKETKKSSSPEASATAVQDSTQGMSDAALAHMLQADEDAQLEGGGSEDGGTSGGGGSSSGGAGSGGVGGRVGNAHKFSGKRKYTDGGDDDVSDDNDDEDDDDDDDSHPPPRAASLKRRPSRSAAENGVAKRRVVSPFEYWAEHP
jgi:hypothetical protein